MKTITEALHYAVLLLEQSPTPRIDAQVLLCHVLNVNTSYLYTWSDKSVTDTQLTDFQALVARRQCGEPIAYIIGYRDFWTLRLHVSPSTLIPRPETELLVELALAHLIQTPCNVLDLGCGTGAIALAMASERPDIRVTGVDLQQEAVSLCIENQMLNQIENAYFLQSNWFEALANQRFSMIMSNPPYIDAKDPHLSEGDVRFEPLSALVASEQGLADIRHICQQSVKYLEMDGWILIEHGFNQGAAVREIFQATGFTNIATKLDYSGLERITLGQKQIT